MPFESKTQMKWMFKNHPKMAQRWAQHTPDISKLPNRKGFTRAAAKRSRP